MASRARAAESYIDLNRPNASRAFLGKTALTRLAALIGRTDGVAGALPSSVLFRFLFLTIASLLAFGHDVLLIG
jgi:hypothetical protein